MPQPYYVLEIRYTDGSSERHEIRDAKRIMGRSKIKADLQVADAKVSGAHAELRFEGGELTVRDLGSTNGTHFHGTRMQGDFQLLVGESCKVGDATVALLSIEGLEPEGAKTMVGAPIWAEDDESTRALDPAVLAAIQAGASSPPASAPAPMAAPVRTPTPAPRSQDWSAAYASSEDNTPPGGAQLPPPTMRPKVAASQPQARPLRAASMVDDTPALAPPRKGLRWLLVALGFVVALATMGFTAIMGYAYVLNKDTRSSLGMVDAQIAQYEAQSVQAAGLDAQQAEVLQGWVSFYKKYKSAVVLVGWGVLVIGALSLFLFISSFLRSTSLAWIVGGLGLATGVTLVVMAPQFDFSLITALTAGSDSKWVQYVIQPQTIAIAATGAFVLQALFALGATTLGRRAKRIEMES